MAQNRVLRLVARSADNFATVLNHFHTSATREAVCHELGNTLYCAQDFEVPDGMAAGALKEAILAQSASLSAYALLPANAPATRLAVFDTDSTFIDQEVIDEIADFAGRKAEVAGITERAMRGDLDFNAALAERVRLLAGLDVGVLAEVRDTRLALTKGAADLVHALHAAGVKTYLVSGGFNFFTSHFSRLLSMTGEFANELESEHGKLTGRTRGAIVNRQRKAELLATAAAEHGIAINATIAVGDGANDIDMCRASGVGIAFCAKPALQNETQAAVFERDLRLVLPLIRN